MKTHTNISDNTKNLILLGPVGSESTFNDPVMMYRFEDQIVFRVKLTGANVMTLTHSGEGLLLEEKSRETLTEYLKPIVQREEKELECLRKWLWEEEG